MRETGLAIIKGETCRRDNLLYAWIVPRNRTLKLTYRTYRRPFARPLATAWGTWSVREGIVLCCRDSGTRVVGFGEIAPLPHFGTETLEQALSILEGFPAEIDFSTWPFLLEQAPPATGFGLWAAIHGAQAENKPEEACLPAALLTLGRNLDAQIAALRADGIRTFKFKMGLQEPETEVGILEGIMPLLGKGARIRLDPNQSWDHMSWNYWQPWLEHWRQQIEFVEEPFPAGTSPEELIEAANASPVPLALDESLSENGFDFWVGQNWPGYWVIKPSLCGDPVNWVGRPEIHPRRVVLSSAFETGIGLSTLVALANHYPHTDHGLGTQNWFNDTWRAPEKSGRLYALANREQQQLWNSLPSA